MESIFPYISPHQVFGAYIPIYIPHTRSMEPIFPNIFLHQVYGSHFLIYISPHQVYEAYIPIYIPVSGPLNPYPHIYTLAQGPLSRATQAAQSQLYSPESYWMGLCRVGHQCQRTLRGGPCGDNTKGFTGRPMRGY